MFGITGASCHRSSSWISGSSSSSHVNKPCRSASRTSAATIRNRTSDTAGSESATESGPAGGRGASSRGFQQQEEEEAADIMAVRLQDEADDEEEAQQGGPRAFWGPGRENRGKNKNTG